MKFTLRDVDVSFDRYKALNKTFLPFYAETKIVNADIKSADLVGNSNSQFPRITFAFPAIEELARLDFDMLSYSLQDLSAFTCNIFKLLNYHSSLGIKDETLKGLVHEIADNYNIVPYHNFTHAFSVFQVSG